MRPIFPNAACARNEDSKIPAGVLPNPPDPINFVILPTSDATLLIASGMFPFRPFEATPNAEKKAPASKAFALSSAQETPLDMAS